MGAVISVVNQKGGVGKTTTALNLGAYLASLGKKVLLVDLDAQGNATSGLGFPLSEVKNGLYEALSGEIVVNEVILKTRLRNLDLIPATPALAGANIELVSVSERETRIQALLEGLRSHYDVLLIDSPPSLGLLTVNGLVASDYVLIPIQSEYYALEGLGHLLETIELIQVNLKPNLKIIGAVVTLYDRRTKLSLQVERELQKHFPGRVFDVVIPRNIRLAEAPSHGQTILEYAPHSKGARAYRHLALELLAAVSKEDQVANQQTVEETNV